MIGARKGGPMGGRRNTVKSFDEKVEDTLCSINDLIHTVQKSNVPQKGPSGNLRAKLRQGNNKEQANK